MFGHVVHLYHIVYIKMLSLSICNCRTKVVHTIFPGIAQRCFVISHAGHTTNLWIVLNTSFDLFDPIPHRAA